MSTERGGTATPLLLLDVDGVINDLAAVMKVRPLGGDADDRAERLGVEIVRANGFWLAIPHDMPRLIQDLTDGCETWWCTTWRGHANDEIATHLGVGPFPVIDDGNGARGKGWKLDAARPLITRAVDQGRPVVWIEDFNGNVPDIAGVTFIDTGQRGVLQKSDLPAGCCRSAA